MLTRSRTATKDLDFRYATSLIQCAATARRKHENPTGNKPFACRNVALATAVTRVKRWQITGPTASTARTASFRQSGSRQTTTRPRLRSSRNGTMATNARCGTAGGWSREWISGGRHEVEAALNAGYSSSQLFFQPTRTLTIALIFFPHRERRKPGFAAYRPQLIGRHQLVGRIERSQVHFHFIAAPTEHRRAAAPTKVSSGIFAGLPRDRHRIAREDRGSVE